MWFSLFFLHQQIEEDVLLTFDTGYYYCHYEGAEDLKNDMENVDSTYVYVYGKGTTDSQCYVLGQ